MKRAGLVLLLTAAVLVSGCSPSSRAADWATHAGSQCWQAKYTIVFHQVDEDIRMTVHESRGETLVVDVTMPSGSLCLEYNADNLLINLDRGELEWADPVRQPPYYTLSELSRQIAAAAKPGNDGEWASAGGYLVKVKDGIPTEVKYQTDWTIYVQEFIWE